MYFYYTVFQFSIHCISIFNTLYIWTANSPLWMLHLGLVSFSLLILEAAAKNLYKYEKIEIDIDFYIDIDVDIGFYIDNGCYKLAC